MDLIKQSLLFRASTCCRSSSEGNCWHRCLATEAHGWKFSPNGRLPPREAKEPLPFSPVVSKWVFLLMIHRTTGIPGSLENKSGKKWDLTDDENTPICVSAPWRRVYEVLTRQHRVTASTNEPRHQSILYLCWTDTTFALTIKTRLHHVFTVVSQHSEVIESNQVGFCSAGNSTSCFSGTKQPIREDYMKYS